MIASMCLALALYHEARGESRQAQLMVARVIINRVESKRWPSSICGVVMEDRQFSFVRNGKVPNTKNKDAWQAADKVRREKWEKEKIGEIRAQTIKGLEPEIQRIVERNKDELRKAHDLHQRDVRGKKEELTESYDQKISDMREKLLRDKEEALDRERERSQQKLHEQYERLENQFQDERKRWKESMFEENTRVEAMLKMENDRLKQEAIQIR